MIKLTNIFTCSRIDENSITLAANDKGLSERLTGRRILAQYQVDEKYLLILEADPSTIIAYVLNEGFQIIDEQAIGHWYFDSYFENAETIQPDTLQFAFGTTGTIKVANFELRGSPLEKTRYLICSNLPIEKEA